MKKPRFSLLVVITLLALAFTVGLYCGRNIRSNPISLSIPEEMQRPQIEIPDVISYPIDINSAGFTELTALPGIGDVLAQRIIEYRNSIGQFTRVDQLMDVPGIGESRLDALKDLIVVGGTQ